MPKAVANHDARVLAQTLVLQGLPTRIVTEELHSKGFVAVSEKLVAKWKSRFGWGQQLTQARQVLVARSEPNLPSEVAEQSIALRKSLARKLSQATEVVDRSPAPKTLGQLEKQQQQLSPLLENGSRLFRWDQQGSLTIASVQALSSDLPEQQKAITDTEPDTGLPEPDLRKTVDSPVLNSSFLLSEQGEIAQIPHNE